MTTNLCAFHISCVPMQPKHCMIEITLTKINKTISRATTTTNTMGIPLLEPVPAFECLLSPLCTEPELGQLSKRSNVTESATFVPPSTFLYHFRCATVADSMYNIACPNDGSRCADHLGCEFWHLHFSARRSSRSVRCKQKYVERKVWLC